MIHPFAGWVRITRSAHQLPTSTLCELPFRSPKDWIQQRLACGHGFLCLYFIGFSTRALTAPRSVDGHRRRTSRTKETRGSSHGTPPIAGSINFAIHVIGEKILEKGSNSGCQLRRSKTAVQRIRVECLAGVLHRDGVIQS